MYYRVAIQVDHLSAWQWKSTMLSELSALFQWFRLHRALPHDRLRVFSCSSREEMNEQIGRENQGQGSTSVTLAQFLEERRIASPEVVWGASAHGIQGNERTTSIALVTESPLGEKSREPQPLDERGISSLERRRIEFERGAGGDHDCPYRFTRPRLRAASPRLGEASGRGPVWRPSAVGRAGMEHQQSCASGIPVRDARRSSKHDGGLGGMCRFWQ